MIQILRDPPSTKPRIRYEPGRFAYPWTCTSPAGTCSGETPYEAYMRWAKDLVDWWSPTRLSFICPT